MTHVGVQRLGTGGSKKDAAQNHKARLIVRTQQHLHGIDRVKRLQNDRILQQSQQAGNTQKREPHQHGRSKSFTDFTGTGVLHRKQDADNGQRDQHHHQLTFAQQFVHQRDAAKAFHRRGNRHRRRQNAVSQQGRTAQNRRDHQPFAVMAHQRIEGKDAAFPVVIGLHGNDHIFNGGQQRHRPDHQRQRTDNKIFTNGRKTTVALHDGFHHVQRRSSDVAINDTDGHKKHAKSEFFL